MSRFAVSVLGRDRPGIVAAIAERLLALDGNVEDSRMTILGGHFAVMLLVETPDDRDAEQLEEVLKPAAERLELQALTVSEIGREGGTGAADHVLTVYGSDHPGILHAVSGELASASVNITDLQTRLAGSDENPIYVMMLEVHTGAADVEELRERLARVGDEAAVEVELRELGADAL